MLESWGSAHRRHTRVLEVSDSSLKNESLEPKNLLPKKLNGGLNGALCGKVT